MNSIDVFLVQYGLLAIFIIMFTKSVGVPIPIPADVIILATAVRAAAGKFVVWQAFLVILLAVVLGGLIQFWLVRGPGRSLLYRFGRYIGLTSARLDAASAKVKKGGVIGLSVAILVPGVRAAAVAASGLADFRLRTFVPGLVLGSTLFLALHFFLGYLLSLWCWYCWSLYIYYGQWQFTAKRWHDASWRMQHRLRFGMKVYALSAWRCIPRTSYARTR